MNRTSHLPGEEDLLKPAVEDRSDAFEESFLSRDAAELPPDAEEVYLFGDDDVDADPLADNDLYPASADRADAFRETSLYENVGEPPPDAEEAFLFGDDDPDIDLEKAPDEEQKSGMLLPKCRHRGRHRRPLCCYYLQGRCRFDCRECWFSHKVRVSRKPWLTRACQFGEKCLRGHWLGLLANMLPRAKSGVVAAVFGQATLRQQICGFLKPRTLPPHLALAVEQQSCMGTAVYTCKTNQSEEDKWFPSALPPTLRSAKLREELRMLITTSDLQTTTVGALRHQLEVAVGLGKDSLAADELRPWIASVMQDEIQKFVKQQVVHNSSPAANPCLTVSGVKSLIAEHVQDGIECGYGLHLDGTIDALEEELQDADQHVGVQSTETKSRWRQWIIEEAILQDCGVVL